MNKWIAMTLLALCTSAWAVGTSHWKHTSAADFDAGDSEGVVATNFGDLRLSRQVKTLLEQDPALSAVYCMAEAPDGTIYAGTGPEGVLLSIKDQKVNKVLTLKGEQNIFSLLIDEKGRVLMGTGGERGRILRLEAGAKEPIEIFGSDKARYIWAMVRGADGTIYAATGPNGQLFAITADGKNSVLFKSNESNLLSMISDGKDTLYVGTDPNGLVYRINRKSGESFVLLDAAETEISALALDAKGNLYAATGQAAEREMAKIAVEKPTDIGRPEQGGVQTPSTRPTDPPAEPKAPEAHQQTVEPKMLTVLDDEGPDSPTAPGRNPPGRNPPGRPNPTQPAAPETPTTPTPRRPVSRNTPEAPANGNAIYRIEPEGFVTEVFRGPEMILSLLERGGTLIAGTGSEGKVYEVKPSAEETVVVATVDPHEVLCLLAGRDGQIYMGLANFGGISVMSTGFAAKGTFTSAALDATQISKFGKLQFRAVVPEGTAIKVATRSGNVQDPDADGWSPWTEDVGVARFLPITSPAARYFQYRVTLLSSKPDKTPVLDEVDVAYQMPNLAPRVTAIRVEAANPQANAAEGEAAQPGNGTQVQKITWTAEDVNGDGLVSSLYFRQVPGGEWILLKDKLTASEYLWDTRAAGDGRYEIKVEASDAAANPAGTGKTASRISDPIVVDNTPPEFIEKLVWQKQAGGAKVSGAVGDRTSIIAAIAYSVDSAHDWQAILPSDSICDEPQETVSFTVGGLTPGNHQVTVRVTDAQGNRSFQSVTIVVPAPAAGR